MQIKKDEVIQRWQQRLDEFLQKEKDLDSTQITGSDFQYDLKITFGDGSFAFFHNAFYVLARDWNEVAVFTEHCGYHIFPLFDTRLALLKSKWTDVGN